MPLFDNNMILIKENSMPRPAYDNNSHSHHSHHHHERRKISREEKKDGARSSVWTPPKESKAILTEIPTEATPIAEALSLLQDDFDTLAAEMIQFPEIYNARRKQMDAQRFFNHYRPETNTLARKAAAEFIKTMAELIQSNRELIEAQDTSILLNALSGILLVQFKKIDEAYKQSYPITQLLTSIRNSAMAMSILDILKIDSFEKLDPATFKVDLEALKKCLAIINTERNIENEDVIAFIADIDTFLEPARIAEPAPHAPAKA